MVIVKSGIGEKRWASRMAASRPIGGKCKRTVEVELHGCLLLCGVPRTSRIWGTSRPSRKDVSPRWHHCPLLSCPMDAWDEQLRRSRKQLWLWSALLLAWVFIGIDPTNMTGTPGDAAKALTNPSALPACLILAVIYCWYRWTQDWFHCGMTRMHIGGPIGIDVSLTVGIACFAVLSGVVFLTFEGSGHVDRDSLWFILAASQMLVAYGGILRAVRVAHLEVELGVDTWWHANTYMRVAKPVARAIEVVVLALISLGWLAFLLSIANMASGDWESMRKAMSFWLVLGILDAAAFFGMLTLLRSLGILPLPSSHPNEVAEPGS